MLGLEDSDEVFPEIYIKTSIIRLLIMNRAYHIVEALIDKDSKPQETIEYLSCNIDFKNHFKQLGRLLGSLITDNQIRILDWIRKLKVSITWSLCLHLKLTVPKIDSVTKKRLLSPEYDDLSTLSYIINHIKEGELWEKLEAKELDSLKPFLQRAVRSALLPKHRHKLFALACVQHTELFERFQEVLTPLLLFLADLNDGQAHIVELAQGNPSLLNTLIVNNRFDLADKVILVLEKIPYNMIKLANRRDLLEEISLRYLPRLVKQKEFSLIRVLKKVFGHRIIDNYLKNVRAKTETEFIDAIKMNDDSRINELLDDYPDLINLRICSENLDTVMRPLLLAVLPGCEKALKTLLERTDLIVNMSSAYDWRTPLHRACIIGNLSAIRILLLDSRIFVNMQTLRGFTPLHMALMAGHTDIVKALLADSRVDVDQKTNSGDTAFTLANQTMRELFPQLASKKYSDLSQAFPKPASTLLDETSEDTSERKLDLQSEQHGPLP